MNPGSRKSVLLVEDEYLVAILTEEMLAEIGFEVKATAASLEAGLKAVETDGFDFAVLDVNLRGKLSFPIADALKERGIPYLFASGYTGQAIEPAHAEAIRIQKPFTQDALHQAIKRMIETS